MMVTPFWRKYTLFHSRINPPFLLKLRKLWPKPYFLWLQEITSNGTAADDWQLVNLNVDDVEIYDDNDDDVNSITAAEAVTSPPGVHHLRYTVTGLTASTSYTGRLRAANVFGVGDWSPEFSFKTAVHRMYTHDDQN